MAAADASFSTSMLSISLGFRSASASMPCVCPMLPWMVERLPWIRGTPSIT
jgi:hypothetical protein